MRDAGIRILGLMTILRVVLADTSQGVLLTQANALFIANFVWNTDLNSHL